MNEKVAVKPCDHCDKIAVIYTGHRSVVPEEDVPVMTLAAQRVGDKIYGQARYDIKKESECNTDHAHWHLVERPPVDILPEE